MTRILFLTVGTGNKNDLEKTLYSPLRKSMLKDYFDYFVLFPSTETEDNAKRLANEDPFKNKVIIETLPEPLMEHNSDKCFGYFNFIIEKYKNLYNLDLDDIEIDLTRGTKAMSSAIYSAGLRHNIYKYRYVTSIQRTDLGQVVSGTEVVNTFNATMGIFLSKIDQVKLFLKSYNFSAISTLFENEKMLPSEYKKTGRYIKSVADFYGSWHRLDYENALKIFPTWGETVEKELNALGLNHIIASQDICDWIAQLEGWNNSSKQEKEPYPTKDECLLKAKKATKIALDLLANGRRQIDMGNYEDAIVRAYRIIEMIGQIYLFEKGYDSANINPEDKLVKQFVSQPNNNLTVKNNVYSFHRSNVATFIKKYFDYNLGEKLFNIMDEKKGECIIGFEERNTSILIHGFSIKNQKDVSRLTKMFNDVERLLKNTLTIYTLDLEIAHKINSFKQ